MRERGREESQSYTAIADGGKRERERERDGTRAEHVDGQAEMLFKADVHFQISRV